MKKSALHISIAILSLAGWSAAQAADGTISFTGDLITSACRVETATANQTVNLPKVARSTLDAAGKTTGRVGFQVKVTGCDAAAKVAVGFEAGPNVNPATGRLKPLPGTPGAPAAGNIEIAILNESQEQILIGSDSATSRSQFVDTVVGGDTILKYFAEYVATGEATAGKANSSVTYSLIYQ